MSGNKVGNETRLEAMVQLGREVEESERKEKSGPGLRVHRAVVPDLPRLPWPRAGDRKSGQGRERALAARVVYSPEPDAGLAGHPAREGSARG